MTAVNKIKNPEAFKAESKFWSSPIFLGALALKVVVSFFIASSHLKSLYLPFISWHIKSGFQNPWEYFQSMGLTQMFPYSSLMLWILTLPQLCLSFLTNDWQVVTGWHLAAARVPLLGFDILLLYFLYLLFPFQKKKLLLIYWCSPITFFVSYMYGQLEVIPATLFFVSVYLLIRERYAFSALALGLSLAAKTHMVIAIPFLIVYLVKKRLGIKAVGVFIGVLMATVFALFSPYLLSASFWQMTLFSSELRRLFHLVIPVTPDAGIIVYPLMVTIFLIRFIAYPKLNREILMMFLGTVFLFSAILVFPTPGGFIWSTPFLIYFYMHNKGYSRAPFVIYNAIYFIYFLSFYESRGNWVEWMMSVFPVRSVAFTVLLAASFFIGFWMFKLGMRKNEEMKALEKPLLIGIGGDSGSGKHTALRVLQSLLGRSRCLSIMGDNFHNWERGNQNWDVYTHLNPSANRLHESADAAVALREGREIEMVHYDHSTGQFTRSERVRPNKFVFFVGLHPFFLNKMRQMIPLKIYLDTDETLRKYWKMKRDVVRRGYRPEKVMAQIASREEDRLKFIQPQKEFADLVISYSAETASISSGKPVLKVSFLLDNSVDMKNLHVILGGVSGLEVSHSVTVYKQLLTVQGEISARQVMDIANQMNIDFEELGINPKGWVKGDKGIMQLIFLLLYHHHMKA